MTKKLKASP